VTKRKASALAALGAFEKEQKERERKAEELKQAAALELGHAVLEAGAGALDLALLKTLVIDAVRRARMGSGDLTAKSL
jgi:hypothetical protein